MDKREGIKIMTIEYIHNFRETRDHYKTYINHVVNEFTQHYGKNYGDNIKRIEYGKQDMRGAPSITLFNDKHCVPHQRHFSSNKEMFSFIEGYMACLADSKQS